MPTTATAEPGYRLAGRGNPGAAAEARPDGPDFALLTDPLWPELLAYRPGSNDQ
jgi:hypothetical protein